MVQSCVQRTGRHIGLWVLLAISAFGQNSRNYTPTLISGTVFDPSDAVVVGASVSLASHDREIMHTRTDGNGQFRFDGITPGRYELSVEQPGFKTQRAAVKVGARAPNPVRIDLAIAELQESVKVDSQDGGLSLDPNEGANVIRLDPEQLESLPMMDGDIIGALSRLLDPASIGTGGPTVIVDGLPGSARGIPISEIAEVRISSNSYSAEYAKPGRGRIEIITKSGSSSYHGSLNFILRDFRLDARNAFAVERPPERRRELDASLSGPIHKGHKKDTFTLSISHNQDAKDHIIYGIDLNGPLHGNADQVQTNNYLTAQFTHQMDKNALSFRYSASDWASRGQGAGGFVLPETGFSSTDRYQHLYSSYRAVISPKLLNEFYVKVGTENTVTRSSLTGVPKIVVLDSFTSGGAQVATSGTDNRGELSDILSWSHGRQFLKAGVNIPVFGRLGSDDRSNSDGTFYFASLDNYSRRAPYSFTRQAGDGHLVFWQKQVGAFVQDEIRLRRNLSVALGLRYDWQNYVGRGKNFAPRLSLAFAPGNSRKIVFRAGGGFFYDVGPAGAIRDVLLLDGHRLQQIQMLNPNYPDPLDLVTGLTAIPPNIVRFSPTLRSPYTFQYSFGVERQLWKSLTLNSTYVGMRGVDLFRSRDVNAPFPPSYDLRPDPLLGVFRQIESSGGLKTHALETTLQGKLGHVFKGMVVYELRHARNDTNGINSFPANSWDLNGEWSRASFDRRNYVYLYGTLNAGKLFTLGLIFSAGSGHPYTMTTGHDDFHDGMTNARPPGVPRNSLQESGSASLDLRWSRDFSLHSAHKEGPHLATSVDAFNVFNQVNFNTFIGNISSPFFGHAVAADPARRLQASIAVKF